ncbi:MAG TPA: hypothetical protein VFH61_15610 [Thermoleophilia bacterium]|nr:hypothetical protein [Thermoleophilia bacterium]
MSISTGILEFQDPRRAAEVAAGDAEHGTHRRMSPSGGADRCTGIRVGRRFRFAKDRE